MSFLFNLSKLRLSKKKPKQKKIVTTVRVFPSTLARIKTIVIYETNRGSKIRNGDVIDQAIDDFFKKSGLKMVV